MAADDDVLHLEVGDGVGDDALAVDVGGGQDVGDVAVHEDVARLEAEDGGFGDAGVGAADPEDLGLLAGREGGEEVGLVVGGCLGPLLVLVEGEFEGVCVGKRRGCLLAILCRVGEYGEGVTCFCQGRGLGEWSGRRRGKD